MHFNVKYVAEMRIDFENGMYNLVAYCTLTPINSLSGSTERKFTYKLNQFMIKIGISDLCGVI